MYSVLVDKWFFKENTDDSFRTTESVNCIYLNDNDANMFGGGGMPPGMPDMTLLLGNPQLMPMAMQMMQNPEVQNLMTSLMTGGSGSGGGGGNTNNENDKDDGRGTSR